MVLSGVVMVHVFVMYCEGTSITVWFMYSDEEYSQSR